MATILDKCKAALEKAGLEYSEVVYIGDIATIRAFDKEKTRIELSAHFYDWKLNSTNELSGFNPVTREEFILEVSI